MKLIPNLLISLSLLVGSNLFADGDISAENNLNLINSELAKNNNPLVNNQCIHDFKNTESRLNNTLNSATFDSRNKTIRRRVLHASNTNESLKSKELTRLDNITVTPGINVFNFRISQVKSQLNSKRYANSNRYVNRTELTPRMNLQLDSKLSPVYSSLMFTRSAQKLSIELPISNSTELGEHSTSLSEKQRDTLIESIRVLNKEILIDNQLTQDLRADNNHKEFCTFNASIS